MKLPKGKPINWDKFQKAAAKLNVICERCGITCGSGMCDDCRERLELLQEDLDYLDNSSKV